MIADTHLTQPPSTAPSDGIPADQAPEDLLFPKQSADYQPDPKIVREPDNDLIGRRVIQHFYPIGFRCMDLRSLIACLRRPMRRAGYPLDNFGRLIRRMEKAGYDWRTFKHLTPPQLRQHLGEEEWAKLNDRTEEFPLIFMTRMAKEAEKFLGALKTGQAAA